LDYIRIVEEAEVYLGGELTIIEGESRLVAFFRYSNSHEVGYQIFSGCIFLGVIPLEAALEVGGVELLSKYAGLLFYQFFLCNGPHVAFVPTLLFLVLMGLMGGRLTYKGMEYSLGKKPDCEEVKAKDKFTYPCHYQHLL